MEDEFPVFSMPHCWKHNNYKRRCRKCNREMRRQFEDVCISFWRLARLHPEDAERTRHRR